MRLEAGGTIDALRTTRPSCLMCSRTEQYPQQELGGPEAQPRWKCPQRSGLLTWFALLTMPSATFFGLVAPLLVGETPAGVLVASLLTYLTATLMMALTAFSDPGTVPPATAGEP